MSCLVTLTVDGSVPYLQRRKGESWGIRLRNTFLDVEEAKQTDVTIFRRTLSAPDVRIRDDSTDLLQDEEKEYVAGLADRMRLYWELDTPVLAPVDVSACSVASASRAPEVSSASEKGCSRSPFLGYEEPPTMLDSRPFDWSADMDMGEGDADGHDGSLGHPELCARPCLFFASGNCVNGSECEFCHLPHARVTNLKRDLREHLRQMHPLCAKAMVLPIIEQRALEIDSSAGTAVALDRLLRACPCAGAPSMKKSRRDRALLGALHDLSLRLVLACLRRSVLLPGEHEAHLAAEALAHQLRCVSMPQGGPARPGLLSL